MENPGERASSAMADNRCTMLLRIHHAAIICSDYEASNRFYTQVLGLAVIAEHWREARRSWKLDLGLPDGSQVELFSFEDRPARPWACPYRSLPRAMSPPAYHRPRFPQTSPLASTCRREGSRRLS